MRVATQRYNDLEQRYQQLHDAHAKLEAAHKEVEAKYKRLVASAAEDSKKLFARAARAHRAQRFGGGTKFVLFWLFSHLSNFLNNT